jgi:exodeoxyribonuclease-5
VTIWSPQQEQALTLARRWMDDPRAPQTFYLAGYAGTGKTTIAKELWSHAGGRALSAAFTGKAASVMAAKGLPGATTVHRLIYTPAGEDDAVEDLRVELRALEAIREPDRRALLRMEALRRQMEELGGRSKPRFLLKEESEVSAAPLVILDECSMVSQRLGEDLLSFGTKVLVLGDPAQLPPVRGTGYFTDAAPDFFLTEIHRQAAESPILRLATIVREGRPLPRGEWGAARVVGGVTAAEACRADQLLCGTNAKRRAINARQRQLAARAGPWPLAGEKLVCLRNDHQLGLLNGTQWEASRDAEVDEEDEMVIHLAVRPDVGGPELEFQAERDLFVNDERKAAFGSGLQAFTYGYGLTVHKAQASQWGSVILFADWPGRASYNQWLYTGITRAADELTVVVT